MELKYLDEIESYFNDELSEKELQAFEARLESDKELAKEFELYQSVIEGVEHHFDEKVQNVLKDEAKQMRQRERFAPPKTRRWYYAAAAVLLIIAASIFVLPSAEPDYGRLYADNFSLYPDYISNPERSVDSKNELDKIMQQYTNHNYTGVIGSMEKYLDNNPEKYELRLYRGITYMQLSETDKAIEDFNYVIDLNKEFVEQAQWYLALAYLKKKDKEKANAVLDDILKNNDFRSKEAEELLEAF